MARPAGFEPTPTVLETGMLPLTPSPYLFFYLAATDGFEPTMTESKSVALTNLAKWLFVLSGAHYKEHITFNIN